MTSSNLIRLSGLAVMMAAALLLILDIVNYTQGGDPLRVAAGGTHAFQSTLGMIAFVVLLPLGLVGLYARQSEAAGLLGLLGFLAAFAGTGLVAGFGWTNTFIAPALATSPPSFSPRALPQGARSRSSSSA